MGLMSFLTCLGVVVIAGSALSLALDVGLIRRELLPDIRKILLALQRADTFLGERRWPPLDHTTSPHNQHPPQGFFVVWEWCDGVWILRTDLASRHVHPGLPPAYSGAFNGYKVKSWVAGP